jgi:hypothetical protein
MDNINEFVNNGFIKIEIDLMKSIALSFDYDEEDGWWFPLPNLEELVKDYNEQSKYDYIENKIKSILNLLRNDSESEIDFLQYKYIGEEFGVYDLKEIIYKKL